MQRYMRTLHLASRSRRTSMPTKNISANEWACWASCSIKAARWPAIKPTTSSAGLSARPRARVGCGLSLSLPYFDDQMLEMRLLDLEVIPGRTLFIPAFVVLAARREQERVAQDKRLSHSTRIYLVSQLKTLEHAFDSSGCRKRSLLCCFLSYS